MQRDRSFFVNSQGTLIQRINPPLLFTMEVTYSVGPRFIDGVNIDVDVDASIPVPVTEQEISDPVTGIDGLGYEPRAEEQGWRPAVMEALTPLVGFTLAAGVALGTASNAYQNFRYQWALQDPGMAASSRRDG